MSETNGRAVPQLRKETVEFDGVPYVIAGVPSVRFYERGVSPPVLNAQISVLRGDVSEVRLTGSDIAQLWRAALLEGVRCPRPYDAEAGEAPPATCREGHAMHVFPMDDLGADQMKLAARVLNLTGYTAQMVAAARFHSEQRSGGAAGEDGADDGANAVESGVRDDSGGSGV